MNAVDTNVLLYTHDPRDARKQAIAVDIVGTISDVVLLWQVACEYIAASRKLTLQANPIWSQSTSGMARVSTLVNRLDACSA